MTLDYDSRPLSEAQWETMFTGPEWDEATKEALGRSLVEAYEIHSRRLSEIALNAEET